jgi:hypothetical protein
MASIDVRGGQERYRRFWAASLAVQPFANTPLVRLRPSPSSRSSARADLSRFRRPETSQSVHAAAHDLAGSGHSNRSTVLADGWAGRDPLRSGVAGRGLAASDSLVIMAKMVVEGAGMRPVRHGARPHVDDYRSGRRDSRDRAVRAAWCSRGERVRTRPGRTRAGGSPRPEATWVDPVRRRAAVRCARTAGADVALNGYRS